MKKQLSLLIAFGIAAAGFAAPLGKPAPDFSLTGTDGKTWKLSEQKGKTVVLEWFN
jgi:peroxiredoxin Q/BCP